MHLLRDLTPFLRTGAVIARLSSKARNFSTASSIFNVESSDDFSEKVVNSPVPVIVDFHADWCGPCKMLGPRLQAKVLARQGQVTMAKINVDSAGELATDYEVTVVPTVISFKNGEIINTFRGVLEDQQLEAFIDEAINA